ncbi:MAG: hypothetical protein GY928_29870 [Colwellia sp.]|nr:hypothetical protein [Colwellia sp.]
MEMHNNEFNFTGDKTISNISFKWNNEHIVSESQPWGGVNSGSSTGETNKLRIVVSAGRHNSDECANWFTAFVSDNYYKMIHTLGGSNKPAQLNFAITGKLTIDGEAFEICIGQGHHSGNNNWHLASQSLTADNNAKHGRLGKFELNQNGSHEFEVRLR